MAPREDLIASAITFLQDPSVAAAPLEKRRAFLESKNLTNEEIELAFARAGSPGAPPMSSQQSNYGYPPPQYPQAPPYGYGYPYPGGSWAQQAMEPPRRDWRDWFIMATVTSGLGYGLFQIGKRYVMPLIKPPTPEQLEQDKSDITTQFDRAFALIEQLASDTETLKAAEAERNTKLDTTINDVEQVVADLKTANERREQENRRLAEDVNRLRDSIPKALEGWKNDRDKHLEGLSQEMKSLKTLMNNRLQPSQSTPSGQTSASPAKVNEPSSQASGNAAPAASSTTTSIDSATTSTTSPLPVSTATSKKPNRAAIPAWQMAAAKNTDEGSV